MNKRPDGSAPADVPGQQASPGTAAQSAEQPARRPSPGPSATSRARRASAASVETRRPSPRPAAPLSNGTRPAGEPAASAPAASATPPVTKALPYVDGTERPATHGRAPLWLACLLAALVLVGAAALVVVLRLPSGAGSVGDRDRALSSAKTEVPLILSYSYKDFDAGVARAKAQLTGRAVTDYSTAMAKTIKPTAVKVKAVVQAQTDGAGVESVSPDGRQVTVVVFGEQKVTNSSLAAPRTDLFRVRATLDLVGGQWLVSKFDQI